MNTSWGLSMRLCGEIFRGQTERPRIKPAASNACYVKQLIKQFATAGATKVKEAKKLAAFKAGKEVCGIDAHVVSQNHFLGKLVFVMRTCQEKNG